MLVRTLALLSLIAAALPVAAADTPQRQEMAALRSACKADIERLCPDVEPGQGRIKDCLMSHKEAMSAGCIDALRKFKKAQ